MSFDPGPDSAFADYTSEPVTPKPRRKAHLSPGAMRAIRRKAREAEEKRTAADELQRRLEVRRHDATP